MKKIIFLIVCFYFLGVLYGNVVVSSNTIYINQITLCLENDFILTQKNLPKKFDDIPTLKDWILRDKYVIEFVNKLAIVPSAPQIKSGKSISDQNANLRLFAISRYETKDKLNSRHGEGNKPSGRYAILIRVDNSTCITSWIPEKEAQIILKQLNGFDPTQQPLAFQDIVQEGDDRSTGQRKITEKSDFETALDHRLELGKSNTETAMKELTRNPMPLWIGGGILFLAGFVWYEFRKKRNTF